MVLRKTQLTLAMVITIACAAYALIYGDHAGLQKSAFILSTTIGGGLIGLGSGWAKQAIAKLEASGEVEGNGSRPMNWNVIAALLCSLVVFGTLMAGVDITVFTDSAWEGVVAGVGAGLLGMVGAMNSSEDAS